MKHRVLVVDEDPALADILRLLLARNGYEVEVAASPGTALALLAKLRFDVVVSDVVLQGVDGFSLGRQIRGNAATADIPIVFLTALDSVEDEFEGYLAGADAWITKPFRAADLLDHLDRILLRNSRPASSGRLAAIRDAGRVIACVTGTRARLLRAACKAAFCELEVVPALEKALSRADREKFDLLVCESTPGADVPGQVDSFLDHFGLSLPVLFLLEATAIVPGPRDRRRTIRLPATVEELSEQLRTAIQNGGMP